MRLSLLTTLLALVALFAAPAAFAQGEGEGHCLTQPLVLAASSVASQPLPFVKTPPSDLSSAVSRFMKRSYTVAPRSAPSRPLVMCLDPHQPGCQIDLPDVPQRHGSLHLFWDAARATLSFEGLPPAPEGASIDGAPYVGGPREGFARPWLRPPAA